MTTTDRADAPQADAVQEFLAKQVELLTAGDTAGLARRYAEDARLVRFDRVASGRDEIRRLFDDYLREHPVIENTDALQITDNVILYQVGERKDGRLVTAVGTLVFVDGLVWRQTVAFVDHRPSAGTDA